MYEVKNSENEFISDRNLKVIIYRDMTINKNIIFRINIYHLE